MHFYKLGVDHVQLWSCCFQLTFYHTYFYKVIKNPVPSLKEASIPIGKIDVDPRAV